MGAGGNRLVSSTEDRELKIVVSAPLVVSVLGPNTLIALMLIMLAVAGFGMRRGRATHSNRLDK